MTSNRQICFEAPSTSSRSALSSQTFMSVLAQSRELGGQFCRKIRNHFHKRDKVGVTLGPSRVTTDLVGIVTRTRQCANHTVKTCR